MIQDATVPTGREPAGTITEQRGVSYTAARWTSQALGDLADSLRANGQHLLQTIPTDTLLRTWSTTVATYLDPQSPERQRLDPSLVRLCGLSPAGLEVALEAVLGGVATEPARTLSLAASTAVMRPTDARALVLVILASNLPALAVQTLLPALLLRLPILIKSASAEPLFTPAFLRSLVARLPELAPAVAAVTWKGGDRTLEDPLLERCSRVLAYGDEVTLSDLRRRAGDRLFAYGPKTSLAIVSGNAGPEVAAGLARDIALFDQRGCLSIQAVFTDGDPQFLTDAIAEELGRLANIWPLGDIDPVVAAAVQQLRGEALMRGLSLARTPLATGTVVLEPLPRFQPSPGLRTIRVHPVQQLDDLPEILSEWSGRLQGAALAGSRAWQLRAALEELGVTRFAPPGELQRPDASWHNGGVHPLQVLLGGTAAV